ncbi:MAG: glutamate 5-kinase [Eubacteriales bacterium]
MINAKRIVVKVGSSTLTHPATGKINLRRIDELTRTLADLMNAGKEVVLVSSGAMAVGRSRLGVERSGSMAEKQASAAVGQCELMYLYDRAFANYSKTTAQVLLTRDVIDRPHCKENVENTLEALLAMGVIPIVNENDTVSYEEIEIGDNDTLSAIVATLVGADTLVLLTDIDGLYNKNPAEADAKLVPVVYQIDDDIRAVAGGAGSKVGTGGMITKIHAAEIATQAGITMVIAKGEDPSVLYDIFDGKAVGTVFLPQPKN